MTAKLYRIDVLSLGTWYAFTGRYGRSAARREALRLAYDCGFGSYAVRVVTL